MYILGIDPAGESGKGGETGVVWCYLSDTEPIRLVNSWAVPAGVAAFSEWMDKADIMEPDLVICENFVQWEPAADISPLKLIGAVQYIWPDVVLRNAGTRSFVTDDQMRLLDMYVAGGHHRDVTEAGRHCVAYAVKVLKHVPTQRVIFER